MQAIVVRNSGAADQLLLTELPEPTPGAGEVLIRVAAAGINRADLLQRQGHYPAPQGASPLLGLEVAGEIVACGPGTSQSSWRVGDHVCALLSGGGYAEYALASAGCCLPVPPDLSLIDAAGLPEAVFTTWANLFARAPGQTAAGALQPGERLLVQGGASGIGTVAIQIAHARGARIAVTAGSAERGVRCRALGAELAASYRDDWASAVHSWAAPHGVDVILDMVGAAYFTSHANLLAKGGRLVCIATQGGAQATVDLRELMRKQLVVTGSTLRSRIAAEKQALRDEILAGVWPLLSSRQLSPIIEARYALADASEAHRAMERGGHFGKLLLVP